MRTTLKIKTRLMLTAGAVAVLMAAVAAAALWSVREVHKQLESALQANARTATSAAQFARLAANLGRQGQLTLNAVSAANAQQELDRWTAMDASASAGLGVLEGTSAGRDAAAPLRASLTEYQRTFNALLQQARAGQVNAELQSRADEALDRLDRQAAEVTSRTADQASRDAAALDAQLTRASIGVVIALAVALVALALAVRFFVYRPITAEATVLADVCAAVERGDITSRVPSPTDTELGAIGRSLNLMLDNTMTLVQSRAERDQMQASIMKLLEEISGVAEGDLTVQAEVTTDVTGAVADSFNFMIAELRRVIGEVQNASRQVSTELAELRSITNELATGSEEQAAQAVDASVAIEEMAASIHYVSENAAVSATVAEEARSNAEHGARAVTRTIEGMKAVRDQVQETAKRIKRLGESSQEIAEIVELIGDIADRTSILALNASIQAAMAGEAGRGFAVVADEVERLAERATEATKRAGMLVKTTQSETAEVMAAMEDTTREVINRSNIANEAGVALTEIQGVSNRLAELIQAISDAAQQQARGSEQVAKSMNEMSSVTRNTASNTKQTASSIASLALLADNLNGSVARFHLPPAAPAPATTNTAPRLVASR
jgi:methyl-accepting chemotaxis protein